MPLPSVLACHNLTDKIIRRMRPRWVRHALPALVARYERFPPMARMGLPDGQRMCVIAPHPDDESIGCGGLIAAWSRAGREVDVVFLTHGERGSLSARDPNNSPEAREAAARQTARLRRDEGDKALAILGARGLWLDGTDGDLWRDEGRLVSGLSAHWRKTPPDLIAAPCVIDRHADHAVAARITAQAAMDAGLSKLDVLGYEVWSPAPANTVFDFTDTAPQKWQAIAAHRSQTGSTDYVAAARAMSAYRAITAGLGDRHAEAFDRRSVHDLAALCAELRV